MVRMVIMGLVMGLSGCTRYLPKEDEQATVINSTNKPLMEVRYIEETTGLQWVSPDLDVTNYQSLLIRPVALHPLAHNVDQIPVAVLEKISQRLTQRVSDKLAVGVPIVEQPGVQTATLNIDITRASTEMEELQITEVLPYGALIGGAKALLGTRDRNVRILVESQLVDSLTGEILAERVSVLLAEDILENDRETLRYEQIKAAVDTFTQDIVDFIRITAYEAKQSEHTLPSS
ncbi:putative outer membrane lipoprotein [Photobacterium aphoticum]|uniref:Putative outer membrane lipoprotein n=1 Tax=Photobacterium aphoticum TaxID=754436 RepID=A0A090QPQ8_9GAMM|nr:putative outer membrane lipoprotein [Photobacterium aphoticum]